LEEFRALDGLEELEVGERDEDESRGDDLDGSRRGEGREGEECGSDGRAQHRGEVIGGKECGRAGGSREGEGRGAKKGPVDGPWDRPMQPEESSGIEMSRERCCKRQDKIDFWAKFDQSRLSRMCGWVDAKIQYQSNSVQSPFYLCRSGERLRRPRDLVLRCLVDETSCSVCGSGMYVDTIRCDTIQVGVVGRYCSLSKPFRPVVPPRVNFPLFFAAGFSEVKVTCFRR
jgi:hypothetical protein